MSYNGTERPVTTIYASIAEYLAAVAAAAAKGEKHLLSLDPTAPWPMKEVQEVQAHLAAAVALLNFHSLRAQGQFREYSPSDPRSAYTTCQEAVRQLQLNAAALTQGLDHLQRLEVAGQVQVSEADRSWLVLGMTYSLTRLCEEAGRLLRVATQAGTPASPKIAAPDPSPRSDATTNPGTLDLSDIPAPLLCRRGIS